MQLPPSRDCRPQQKEAPAAAFHPISRTIEPLFQPRAGRPDIAVEDNNLAFTMRTIRQAVWRKAFEFQAGLYLYGLVIPRDELLSKPVQ
jgi:hypothetical protein